MSYSAGNEPTFFLPECVDGETQQHHVHSTRTHSTRAHIPLVSLTGGCFSFPKYALVSGPDASDTASGRASRDTLFKSPSNAVLIFDEVSL